MRRATSFPQGNMIHGIQPEGELSDISLLEWMHGAGFEGRRGTRSYNVWKTEEIVRALGSDEKGRLNRQDVRNALEQNLQ
jgi:hypothetical protein